MARTNMRDSFAHINDIIGKPKTIRPNTWRYMRTDGTQAWRLHNTDIVELKATGAIVLNSGGWKTVTTKERMSDILREFGYSIYSDRGVWFVTRNNRAKRVPYYDGMTLPQAFDEPAAKQQALVDAQRELKKRIKAYAALIPMEGPLPQPDQGDCWVCSLFNQEKPVTDRAKQVGHARADGQSEQGDTEHLLSHMEEKYMHGALIVNALRWGGHRDEGIRWYLTGLNNGRVRQVVRRYMQRKLGLVT